LVKLWVLFGCAVALGLTGYAAQAQQADQLRNDANAGTVRVLASGVDTAHMLQELAAALNKTGSLRILPIMGDGGVQNVNDTLYLRGIDMALVRYDILELLGTQRTYGAIEKRIRYVAKLFDEELHLIARADIGTIEQLAGRRVNYGDPGSGTFERADKIFRTLGIAAVPVSYSTSQAIEKVRNGEIAATVHVGPRPSPFVRQLNASDGVRLLSVPPVPGLETLYKRASFNQIDYPDLIPQGETINTVAVETVLVVYRWPSPNERSIKVDNFVTTLFDRLGEVQQPDRHPKWREMSLLSDVPGWRRLEVASKWVSTEIAKQQVQSGQATAAVSKPLTRQFEAFMDHMRQAQLQQELKQAQPQPTSAPTNSSNQNLQELFTEFLRWRSEETQ